MKCVHDDSAPAVAPAAPTAAAAVHDSGLWGGPRWIDNIEGGPQFVRTKDEYWALLKRKRLHIQHQAESVNPAKNVEPDPEPERVDQTPAPRPPPITQAEAQLYGCMTAIFKRYGLIESLWCVHCFARHRQHGCRVIVNARRVMIACRCGDVEYQPPVGTTDLVLQTVANTAITSNDHTTGIVVMSDGEQEMRPTVILHAMEALLIRRYILAVQARGKEPRWHHIGCWSGNASREDDACGLSVGRDQIIVLCKCRQLFEQRRKIDPTELAVANLRKTIH